MNDPNAVPLDRIPVSTPSIPRFGGLPELPELPGEFAPLPPYRTPTSVTTVPFPSSPPKVVVEPPKAPPKVTVELPKPVVKTSPPPTVASTAPQPRWVREAIQDLLTPNRKKALALTVAAGLVVGAVALNAGFSGLTSPTRSSNSVATDTTEKQAPPEAKLPNGQGQSANPDAAVPKPIEAMIAPAIASAPVPTPLTPVGAGTAQETILPTLNAPPTRAEEAIQHVWLNVKSRFFWDGGFWEDGRWKASSQLALPNVTELSAADIPYARPQYQITQATFAEPQTPSAPVTGPVAAVAIPLMAPPLAVPDVKMPQPILPSTPPKPMMPDVAVKPVEVAPVAVPGVTPFVPKLDGPLVPAMAAPSIPEPMKLVEIGQPTVPKPVTLISPNGQPGGFQLEPPLPANATPPTPTNNLAMPTLPPQSPAVQSIPQPAPQPAIRPVTNTEVRTAIDVDLHEPKRGDTYASISKMHYGDDRYAAAIQAFNKGRNLGDGAAIELPLTQYLRQNYRQYIGGTPPVSNDPARTPEWAPSAGRTVPTPRTFTVNREGMTMWDVAEDVYGDRQKWKQIQDANPQLDANERYRVGDRFRLPLDAPQTVKRVP